MAKHQNMRLAEACERYVRRLEGEGKAESTVEFVGKVLARLQAAAKGDPYMHILSPAFMEDFCFGPKGLRQSAHRGRPMTAAGFNRYRSVLLGFFGYAETLGWTTTNPMRSIAKAKNEDSRPRLLLNASEMFELLECACNPLERFACALAMNTGLRSADLTRLTVFDVSVASGTIQTQIRKTGKYDIKPVTMELHKELVAWLSFYAEAMQVERSEMPGEWFLVPSYYNAGRTGRLRLYPTKRHQTPYRLVQRPLARMGYPTRQEGFHTLRRSSARIFFETLREAGDGRDHALMVVQDFLNHSSTVQTQHYLGLNEERAIRDHLLKGQAFLSKAREVEQQRAAGSQKVGQIGSRDSRAV